MKRGRIRVALAVIGPALLCGAWSSAQAAAPSDDKRPAPTSACAPAVPADAADVLDKMDAAGKKIETVTARFDYELNQTLYEDIQKREGELAYRAPNLMRFEFKDRPRETFVFDGRALYHKKDATQQLIIWEIRRPDEPAVESLEFGKTLFPLPFGQTKANVVKQFKVSRDKKEETQDKAKRLVLGLVPREGTSLANDYTRIALWVDPKQAYLPTRMRLWDTSENITTVDFRHIAIDKKVPPKRFARPEVPKDWEIVAHAKEGPQEGKASEKP